MSKEIEILAATSSPGKLKELSAILEGSPLILRSPSEIAKEKNLQTISDVPETGSTYRENAFIKARAYSSWAKMPALADDSGLEVVCLDNKPGLHSARYAPTDSERVQRLINDVREKENAEGPQDRTAYFVCSFCYYMSEEEIYYSDSKLKGLVLDSPKGDGGFGYDPIILIEKFGKTLAEIDFELTIREGFRAEAMRELMEKIGS